MSARVIAPYPLSRWQRSGFIAALLVLAVVASWKGVFNQFAFDDQFMIRDNAALHDVRNWWRVFFSPYWPIGWGGDGYRPMTTMLFTFEWVAGAGKPWVFHTVNIALYAATSIAVFYFAETCLPFAAAWLAAALFAVHPVHVEAVANVVGQAELLVAVFFILAVVMYIRRRNVDTFGAGSMVAVAVLYACACLSKEHGIMLPAVLLAAEVVVVTDNTPLRGRLAKLRPFGLALALIAVLYLWAHMAMSSSQGTGFHPYVPFSALSIGQAGRALTMFGLVPEWMRLFLWPARLSIDYGPPAFPVVNEFQPYQVPGMMIAAATLVLGVVTWRKAPAVSIGIWFAVFTLLPSSNFLVPSGILLSERTLFLPSVGVLIAAAGSILWLYHRMAGALPRLAGVTALAVLLILGAWRSSARTTVWKDNDTLFQNAVIDAPRVYRTHFILGAWDLAQKRTAKGEREYLAAIALYDRDPYLFFSLGEEYRIWKLYHPSVTMFRRALEADSTLSEAHARMALSLVGLGDLDQAAAEARKALTGDGLSPSRDAMRAIIRMQARAAKRAREAAALSADSLHAPLPDSGRLRPAGQNARRPGVKTQATKTKPPVRQ